MQGREVRARPDSVVKQRPPKLFMLWRTYPRFLSPPYWFKKAFTSTLTLRCSPIMCLVELPKHVFSIPAFLVKTMHGDMKTCSVPGVWTVLPPGRTYVYPRSLSDTSEPLNRTSGSSSSLSCLGFLRNRPLSMTPVLPQSSSVCTFDRICGGISSSEAKIRQYSSKHLLKKKSLG